MEKISKFKLVLLGNTAVGKSSIAARYVKKQFFEFQEPTIGAAFLNSSQEINDHTVKFEIWDTAGQERYRSLAPMYYRGANAAIVVFDITNIDSFNGSKEWIDELMQRTPNCLIYLVGNKADLDHLRKVNKEEVKEYVRNIGCSFYETSAKNSDNVDLVFEKIAAELIENPNINSEDNNIFEMKKPMIQKKANCC